MKIARIPPNEAQRLALLASCNVLDSAPEPAFDHIAQLASVICGTPIALVSLIDESRQWFKAKVGIDATETPRGPAFCSHAILADAPLIVPDTSLDERFADNPMVVGAPFVRFYAGIPLSLEEGLAVGTLCVVDSVPRDLTATQIESLKLLAQQVTSELNLRRKLAQADTRQRMSPATQPLRFDSYAPTMMDAELLARDYGALPIALGDIIEQRYRIERVIGRGGMGVVVAAHDLQCDERVAIKFMLPSVVHSREALRRFVREALALKTIESEHVAHLHDVGNLPDGIPYIVMEHLDGEDLASKLRVHTTLPLREALDITLQACEGIAAAHSFGVLHRDLKPGNLFLAKRSDGSHVVKVLDFGIAKVAASDVAATRVTNPNTTIGSPHYMAPEQMTHPETVDARADVWSMGVILCELLTGEVPFQGATFAEVCARVLTSRGARSIELIDELPPELSKVVVRCLERERDYRYATMSELVDALRSAKQLLQLVE